MNRKLYTDVIVGVLLGLSLWGVRASASVGDTDFPVVGWSRTDISGANTGSPGKLARIGGSAGMNIPAPFIPTRNGWITGCSWATDDNNSVGGGNYTVAVYLNGSKAGLSTDATGTGTNKCANDFGTPVAFNAGDEIDLRDQRSGSLNAKSIQAQMFLAWDF